MKNIKSLIIVALLGTSFTSCNDFLTLDPLNDIVQGIQCKEIIARSE